MQDGEVVYCNWKPTRDSESGKLVGKWYKIKILLCKLAHTDLFHSYKNLCSCHKILYHHNGCYYYVLLLLLLLYSTYSFLPLQCPLWPCVLYGEVSFFQGHSSLCWILYMGYMERESRGMFVLVLSE